MMSSFDFFFSICRYVRWVTISLLYHILIVFLYLIGVVTALRDFIISGRATETSDLLTVEEGLSFPVSDKTTDVFVRDFYPLFYSHFRDTIMAGEEIPGVIYHGPPGIGIVNFRFLSAQRDSFKMFSIAHIFLAQSHMGMYFLYQLLRDGVTVVYEHVYQNKVFIIPPTGACRVLYGEAREDTVSELCDPRTVHLFDACAGNKAREPASHKGKVAIFTSPNECSYKQFLRSRAMKLIVPSYTREEMEKRRPWFPQPEKEDEDAFEKKIAMCGPGSIRLVLHFNLMEAEGVVSQAIENTTVRNMLDIVKHVDVDTTKGIQGPHTLFTVSLAPGADPLSIESYYPRHVVWTIASKYIMRELINQCWDEAVQFAQRAAVVFQGKRGLEVTGGMFFETIAPQILAKSGTFRVRRLAVAGDSKTEEEKLTAESVVWDEHLPVLLDERRLDITAIADVHKQCQDGSTLYTFLRTMAGFDSFLPPNKYFNFTISASHPISMLAAVEMCTKASAQQQKAHLYFVVPPSRFKEGWTAAQSFSKSQAQASMAKLLQGDKKGSKTAEDYRQNLQVSEEEVKLVDKWLVQYALELDLGGELPTTGGKTDMGRAPMPALSGVLPATQGKTIWAPEGKVDGKLTRGGLGAGGDQVRGFCTMAARAAFGRRGVPARAFVGLLRVFL